MALKVLIENRETAHGDKPQAFVVVEGSDNWRLSGILLRDDASVLKASVEAYTPTAVAVGEGDWTVKITDQDRDTILAALRFYQSKGLGDPANRPDDIHEIATCGGERISLDDDGINDLCERINVKMKGE